MTHAAALLAAALLAQAPVGQANNALADFDRGRAAAAAGDLEVAAGFLERCAQAFPGWGLAHVEYADVLLRQGGAAPQLDQELALARQLAGDNPRTWLLTGDFASARGDSVGAIEGYSRAVELRSELDGAREKLATALLRAGRVAESVPHFAAAVAANPADRTLRANYAESLEQSGDVAGAEQQLRTLADQDPGSVFRKRLARFYERIGQPQKAEQELRKLDAGRQQRKMRPLPPSHH
jgi:uncharacterized protein (TIGR02996 family)